MIKKCFIILFILPCLSFGQIQDLINKIPLKTSQISNTQIADGLKSALELGISKQVSKLTEPDGFYHNSLVKIMLPDDLQKVDKALRNIGLGSLADEGIKALNNAAEDAVGTATPIFVNAVKDMTFTDAKTILLGSDDAATLYLEGKTESALYTEFHPIINASFQKVGADVIWTNLINKYNAIPFTSDVNPDLTDYVTKEALNGVFTMIAVEEKDIRTKSSSRTTNLLKQVFALQDASR